MAQTAAPAMKATKAKKPDLRKEIKRSQVKQASLWIGFIIVVLALLSVFTAGFFLYTAIVMGGLLVFAAAMAGVSVIGIEIRRNVSKTEMHLGETADALLVVDNKKGFPAFWLFWKDGIDTGLDVEGAACHFKTLGSNRKHELKYKLHSTRRGLFRVGPAVLESSGPFGLIRRFIVDPKVEFITVLPKVVPIGKGLAQGQRPIHQVPRRRSIFEDPSRFMGMREYRPGDSMRRIHWRATARSGKLQVKLFEPSVLTGVLLAVDMGLGSYPLTRAHKDKKDHIDKLMELTVTAAASLGQYVLTGDQSVGLISNGTDAAELYPEDWTGGTFHRLDQALEQAGLHARTAPYQPVELAPAKGWWQQERLLTALARLTVSSSIELPDLLMTEIPRLPRQLVLMVVTPRLDAALTGTVESLKRSGIETGIIWTQLPEEEHYKPEALPQNVPVYIVRGDTDLEVLGGQTL
jgi:uncharacterized protein (DUF58 family)